MTSPSSSAAFCLDGELTIYRAAELCASLTAALADVPEGAELEVDLGEVTEFDSAGVQLLMAARKSAVAAGRGFRLTRHSAAVREVFETLQLGAAFEPAPVGGRAQ